MILYFRDKHSFLSNFHHAIVMYDGYFYRSSEHAYQAAKTLDLDLRTKISQDISTPLAAKSYGRQLDLRPDWEEVKIWIMHTIVLDKFTRNLPLRDKLIDTGDQDLIEGNTWGDKFWGQVMQPDGRLEGENHLGRILVEVRRELR